MHFDSWVNRNRVLAVAVLLAIFFAGLWLLRFTILDEMARVQPWHRVAYWIGDVVAVFYAVRWAFTDASQQDAEFASQPQDEKRRIAFKVFLAVVFSLVADISMTAFTSYSIANGIQNMVPATAEVLQVEKKDFNGLADHYTVAVRFDDQAGAMHHGLVKFSLKHAEGAEEWMVKPLAALKAAGDIKKIDVGYDPHWPPRVWLWKQTWGSTAGLSPLFAIIHIAQLIMLHSCFNSSKSNHKDDKSWVSLLPLACEAVLLLIFGLTLGNQ